MQGDYFILCTKASCQHFSPPRRNFFHHKSYSFLSRTVRLTNSNPKALLLGCRGTLAQNRGTMGVQIPFSFPKSLDLKPLQTKVRILPWQMNKTLIKSLSPFKMRYPAAICSDLRGVNSSLCIGHFCTKNANLSKILQDVYSNRSRNVVKSRWDYY